MQRLQTLTIFHKIVIAPLLGLLVFIGYLCYSYIQNQTSQQNLMQIREVRFPVLELTNINIALLESISKYIRDAVVASEPSWLEETVPLDRDLQNNLKTMRNALSEPDTIDAITKSYRAYYANAIQLAHMMISGNSETDLRNQVITQTKTQYETSMLLLEQLKTTQRASYEHSLKEVVQHLDRVVWIGLAVGILATLLITWVTFTLSFKTRKTILEVLESLHKISAGKPDFTKRVKKNSEDEIGELVDCFNIFTEKLEADYQALKEAKKSAEESYRELEKAQKKLVEAEKMASLGNLVAGVAHEINTPVGTAFTTASSLHSAFTKASDENGQIIEEKKESLLSKAQRGFPLILNNLQRASDLIKSFKRVSVDQHVDELRSIDLIHYLSDLGNSLEYEYSQFGHQLIIPDEPSCVITTYPGAIGQIMTNLIMNSIRHGFKEKTGGVMKISIDCLPAGVKIRYEDDGRGIPDEHLDKVCDPFFTTDKQDGTGLGMHVVYNLITQKLGGQISLQSEEGQGVVIDIEIPKKIESDRGEP